MQGHKFIQLVTQNLFPKLIEIPSTVDIPENAHDGNSERPEVSSANVHGSPYNALPRTGYSDRTVCHTEVLVMNDRSAKRLEDAVKAGETLL